MGVRALQLGNLQSILAEPKPGLKHPENWTQQDSDVIAHFIQVHSQIANSRWMTAECRYTSSDGDVSDQQFPDIEDFVYAAVYLRQLIAARDDLFTDAVNRYCSAVDDPSHAAWVDYELKDFHSAINGDTWQLRGITVRQLFDAFMYGAGILHKFPQNGGNKQRLLDLIDNQPRHKVLFALHTSLKLATNHIMRVSLLMRRDFGVWLMKYSLPKPDVRWHYNLLEPKE